MTVIGITEQCDGPHRKDVIAVHGGRTSARKNGVAVI